MKDIIIKSSNPIVENALVATNEYRDDKGYLHNDYKRRAKAAILNIYQFGNEELLELELDAKELMKLVDNRGYANEKKVIAKKQAQLEKWLIEMRKSAEHIIGL